MVPTHTISGWLNLSNLGLLSIHAIVCSCRRQLKNRLLSKKTVRPRQGRSLPPLYYCRPNTRIWPFTYATHGPLSIPHRTHSTAQLRDGFTEVDRRRFASLEDLLLRTGSLVANYLDFRLDINVYRNETQELERMA
jgi:hypothetical protein